MTKFIDASMLTRMVISGAYNLSNNRELVDALNVFPVPDGDTGTNMKMTIEAGAHEIKGFEERKPHKIDKKDIFERMDSDNAIARARKE